MADESFVLVGTPFPQIKKTDAFGDPKRPNPTRDLEVRDEQGRRRFHGAFTGGYSAGYFNTVGSKEGWAPSEFVSSRDKRSERKMNRPEDYMDEEDKQMMKESSRLKTTEDFDTLGSTRKELEHKRAAARNMQSTGGSLGVLPDRIIDDLIIPSSEPVGIRLLKRMGWKPGQGIGPRVTKKQKLPQDTTLSDDEDGTPANITFAPIDSAIVVFTNKSNLHGLGFDPYKHAPEFDTRQQAQSGSKYLSGTDAEPKRGFGFGAFDDDEDDDIYGPVPAPGPDFDSDLLEPASRGRQSQQERSKAKPKTRETPLYCSDGRPPLPGFVLASASIKPLKWYSAPKVPADFVPHHVFPEDIKPAAPLSSRHQQPKLTADDRALVLGETPIDAPRRSVFEYISAENKNRLDSILGMVLDTEGDKSLKKDYFEVPKIEKSSAEAALKGFMPFGDNLAKQSRYKQYLNIQAGLSDETITLVEGFSGADMAKELNEFVQAARIFKPLSSTMSSRFTTASKVIEFAQPAAGLRSAADIKASAADKSSPMHAVVEKMEVPKSQAAKAAAMGMFGPLTRTTVDFYPAKLLCKRFNVPNPHPDHKDTGPEAAKDLLDKTTMDNMIMNRRPGEGMTGDDQRPSVSTPTPDEPEIAETVESQTVNQETKEEEVFERPPMDIFKAIFDDSDSEDEDSDTEATAETAKGLSQIQVAPVLTPVKEQELEGPFRPVFTRKSERGLDTGLARGIVSIKKFDISNQDEDEDENETGLGPKLSISKPTLDRGNKPESISGSKSKGSKSSRKRDTDLENEREAREISKGTRAMSLSEDTGVCEGQSPSDAFKGLTMVEKEEEKDRSASRKASRRSPSPDSPSSTRSRSLEESSKKHKSSHPSSSSKPESSRHRSSHSRSRNRSSSRSRHHDSNSKDSRSRDRDKEKSRHSDSSRSKRHREHRSRSRSPKRRSREKDRDRDDSRRRHGKSGKSSRSDRDGDKYSSSSSSSRREKTKDAYFDEDDDDMWVEKRVEVPVSTTQSPSISGRATISHRPRASEYF
ncbi:hypothetical protein BG005_002962 [Podila minutissima]|nr:hypothetical protein BG005_002962 [Podila minutissima]